MPFRSDYNQYTVNQSVPVQPSVKISEVSAKQYQKPKKVAVNEADKYNLNQDVTVQDYDIYENQVGWKVFCRSFRKGNWSAYRESKLLFFCFLFSRTAVPGSAQQEQVPHYRRPVVQVRKFLSLIENSNGDPFEVARNDIPTILEKIIVAIICLLASPRAFVEMSSLFLLQLRSS